MRGLEDHRQVPVQLLPSAIKWVTQPPWSGQGFPHASPHPRGRQGAPWRSPSWEGGQQVGTQLGSQPKSVLCLSTPQSALTAGPGRLPHAQSHQRQSSGQEKEGEGPAQGLCEGPGSSHLSATAEPKPPSSHQAPIHWARARRTQVSIEALSGASCGDRHCHPLSRPGTYHRRFRGRDPEPLGQNAGEVGGSRPVPQQPPVVQLLERLVALVFPLLARS